MTKVGGGGLGKTKRNTGRDELATGRAGQRPKGKGKSEPLQPSHTWITRALVPSSRQMWLLHLRGTFSVVCETQM